MNKNDILKIAKSLYLQEIISRQLFAKFDPNKQLDFLDGSFARLSQKVQSIFYGFIGSRQDPRKKFPQIVEKNGMKFKIHKINLDNSVSNQIYNNAQYNIHQVAFILRKLYVTVQKGGDLSFKESIKNIKDVYLEIYQENRLVEKINTYVQDLNFSLNKYKGNISIYLKVDTNDTTYTLFTYEGNIKKSYPMEGSIEFIIEDDTITNIMFKLNLYSPNIIHNKIQLFDSINNDLINKYQVNRSYIVLYISIVLVVTIIVVTIIFVKKRKKKEKSI